MEVTLGHTHKVIDLRISTVAVSHTIDNLMMLFRCINCGSAISQYQGMVVKIYPFVEPSAKVLVVTKCPECGSLYTFQTQDFTAFRPAKIMLLASTLGNISTFRCHICRLPLLKFDADKVFDLVDNREIELPYALKCPTSGCSASYYFSEVV